MSVQPFVTVFRSTLGDVAAARPMSMEELERVIGRGPTVPSEDRKETLPLLKLARFGNRPTAKGSLRSDDNVEQISGIEGDYDGEQVSIETAAERLKQFGIEALLHTSARHRPEAPRWRVFCPLAVPLEGGTAQLKAQHGYWLDRLNGALGGILSAESWTLSQAYFFGSIEGFTPLTSIRLAGKCLDQLDELPPAIGKPGGSAPNDDARDAGAELARSEASADIEAIASGVHIYGPTRRLTGRYIAKRLSVAETVAIVRSLLLEHKGAWADQLPRWQEAYDKTERLTEDAAEKRRTGKWTSSDSASDADVDEWGEPLPLLVESGGLPYPADALPGDLGGAVREVVGFVQCPIALAASSALSALSVAAQGLANVRRGPGLEGPVSLYLLSMADSGERKSECDKRFASVLRDWEAEELERLKPDLAKSRAELAAWEQERKAVEARIYQARKEGKPTDEARDALEKLEAEKPEPVRVPRVLLESETAENLAWTLARPDGWPSAGLLSSEAGVIFGGHAMRRDSIMQSLSLLNKFWSGEPHRVGRRTSESFDINGARLTMGLAVQPETVQAFFDESRGLARATGFAARFLIGWPESTQGTRLYREPPSGWPYLTAYQKRLRRLLNTRMTISQHSGLLPPPLDMDPVAFEAWRQFCDGVEVELRENGELADLRDVASKAADNCARVAALFHLFEHGSGGRIAVDDVAQAARIVTWHLREARRFLGGATVPKAVANAVKLEAWLLPRCRERGSGSLTAREVMHRGPNPVRRKVDLLAALAELRDAERAKLSPDGRTILINPALLRGQP
jgi:putative DNA primase/helicase